MSDTTVMSPVLTEAEAAEAFAWWVSLGTPYTQGTEVGDWVGTRFRDVVCFQRYAGDVEAFLVGPRRMIHFGLDIDTLESAYEAMGPARELRPRWCAGFLFERAEGTGSARKRLVRTRYEMKEEHMKITIETGPKTRKTTYQGRVIGTPDDESAVEKPASKVESSRGRQIAAGVWTLAVVALKVRRYAKKKRR